MYIHIHTIIICHVPYTLDYLGTSVKLVQGPPPNTSWLKGEACWGWVAFLSEWPILTHPHPSAGRWSQPRNTFSKQKRIIGVDSFCWHNAATLGTVICGHNQGTHFFKVLVQNPWFDFFFAIAILTNAVFIGFEVRAARSWAGQFWDHTLCLPQLYPGTILLQLGPAL